MVKLNVLCFTRCTGEQNYRDVRLSRFSQLRLTGGLIQNRSVYSTDVSHSDLKPVDSLLATFHLSELLYCFQFYQLTSCCLVNRLLTSISAALCRLC